MLKMESYHQFFKDLKITMMTMQFQEKGTNQYLDFRMPTHIMDDCVGKLKKQQGGRCIFKCQIYHWPHS